MILNRYFRWDIFGGFTDDFELPYHGACRFLVTVEIIETHVLDEVEYVPHGFDNILEIEGTRPPHKKTTSFIISSFICFFIAFSLTRSIFRSRTRSRYSSISKNSNRSGVELNSTSMSMSLPGFSSPRAYEPNTPIFDRRYFSPR